MLMVRCNGKERKVQLNRVHSSDGVVSLPVGDSASKLLVVALKPETQGTSTYLLSVDEIDQLKLLTQAVSVIRVELNQGNRVTQMQPVSKEQFDRARTSAGKESA